MPAFNFQARFATMVARGSKRQTIRLIGKRRVDVGQRFVAYQGMRTKAAEKLCEGVITAVTPVLIARESVRVQGELIADLPNLDKFAQRDGFEDWEDLKLWFVSFHLLPFHGILIQWEVV
jgi:hypothetical protein